jgi:hypothetical protein
VVVAVYYKYIFNIYKQCLLLCALLKLFINLYRLVWTTATLSKVVNGFKLNPIIYGAYAEDILMGVLAVSNAAIFKRLMKCFSTLPIIFSKKL